jgi:hypothetical protein
MKTTLDWSQPQRCRDCGRRLRPSMSLVTDWPGTRLHHGNGLCRPCSAARRRAGIRLSDRVRHEPKRRGNPTVAELAAAGHPCISPAPTPSRVRTYPL